MFRGFGPKVCLAVAAACVLATALPVGAININVSYDDQMLDLNSSGVFNAAEKAVIVQAVGQWQNAITSAGQVNITLLKSNLAGLLGFASNYATNVGDTNNDTRLNGTPVSGTIQVDDRLGAGDLGAFWVDPTPGDNSEFIAGKTSYHFTSPAGGQAANSYDMLSLVKHEVGHVLGFSQSFDNFFNGLVPSPVFAESLRWLYVFGAAPALGPAAQYKPDPLNQFGGFPNGGVYMREYEVPVTGPGPTPSHVDWYTGPPAPVPPASGTGTVAGFFDNDLENPALNLGERKIESDVDLDILADAYGYTVVPEPATLALLALGGLAAIRRRR